MIELDGIYKSFYRKEVLRDISFSVPEGEIFGLLGPNGAGKSTLIRIVNRIVSQDKGYVSFKGKNLTQNALKNIGYLPEERGLYKTMTVEEHAIFLARLRGLSRADAKLNLNKWLQKFEIEDWSKKRIEELSKGMAQKIQFICTVLHEPDFLILDEPFSGFDPINVALIRAELAAMRKQGKTIMLSTHDMKSVEEICQSAVMLHKGKKVLEGQVADLREKSKEGKFAIQFQGNMIAFANTLWAGYEIIEKVVLADDRFLVTLKMRDENKFNDLLNTLLPHINIESAWEVLPSMQDVFIKEVTKETASTNE